MKICKDCNEEKPLTVFRKTKKSVETRRNFCIPCDNARSKARYVANQPAHTKRLNERRAIKRRASGVLTREQFLAEKKRTALGLRVISVKAAAKRRAAKRQATVHWSTWDNFVFEEAVSLCKLREEATKIKWNVDHIVPLQYTEACGLHCADNFQVVPASWNIRKSNNSMAEYDFT